MKDLANDAGLVCLRACGSGGIVGVLGYTIGQPWWAKEGKTCLQELFVLQIDPAFYGFGRWAIKFFKAEAKSLGCSLLETAVSITVGSEARMAENTYMKYGKPSLSYSSFVWVLPQT